MHTSRSQGSCGQPHSEERFILGEVSVTNGSDAMEPETSPGRKYEATPELQPGLPFNEMIFMLGEGYILPMHISMSFFMKVQKIFFTG